MMMMMMIRYYIVTIFISNINEFDYNPLKLNNVHKINLNIDTENNLKNIKKYYQNKNIHFKYIFCKNYKIFPYFRYIFNDSYLIFSPSGLRILNSLLESQFISDLNYQNIFNCDTTLLSSDLYNFIRNNDKFLDIYAIKNSDIVVPNSTVTYNIINNLFPNIENLTYPINFTNIILNDLNNSNNLNNSNDFNQREYDVAFIAYNWKRKIKNYNLVVDIINKIDINPLKIVVVGLDQTKYFKNIVSFIYLNNDNINILLKKCKTIVITSFYDSNPNILIEAISNGCNIVTTKNVGNHENIDSRGLVGDYNNTNEWIKVIKRSLNKPYNYYGEYNKDILIKLDRLFYHYSSDKKCIIGIYKIPTEWNINFDNPHKVNIFTYEEREINDSIKNIINYDIYFDN
jgi:hypothetical protein